MDQVPTADIRTENRVTFACLLTFAVFDQELQQGRHDAHYIYAVSRTIRSQKCETLKRRLSTVEPPT